MLVMYLGKIVEQLPCDDIYADARHPYTQALLKSNPINDPNDRGDLYILDGEVPSPRNPPAGCPFVTRCEIAEDRCNTDPPELKLLEDDRHVACWAVTDPA